jgi:hypothetical protein
MSIKAQVPSPFGGVNLGKQFDKEKKEEKV